MFPCKGHQTGSVSLRWGGSAFLFSSGLQLIGQGPPAFGRAICSAQPTNQMLISSRNTQNNVCPNTWVTPTPPPPPPAMTQPSWHIDFHHNEWLKMFPYAKEILLFILWWIIVFYPLLVLLRASYFLYSLSTLAFYCHISKKVLSV